MVILAGLAALWAAPAQAQIGPATTLDGPSSAITEFGGVAMASDGTGGLVYVKAVAGVPHVFACRFVEGHWTAPLRVDTGNLYEASQPRIAAGPGGELLVVWVAPDATVKSKLQYGLFSARLGGGLAALGGESIGFAPAQLVDPSVGEGVGIDPSVAGTSPGKAVVAYRVITFTFGRPGVTTTAVELRKGDVLSEVRVARLSGDRWSRLGAMNHNAEASSRPPTATNGPQIGIGLEGNAVVAWQEADQTGAARILLRRLFGSTPGPILQASPTTWEGAPVTADADAFSLVVTNYAAAEVAFRIAAERGSPLAGRLLVNSLPANFATTAGTLVGAELADAGSAAGSPGPPALATVENATRAIENRVAYVANGRLRQLTGGVEGMTPLATPATPAAQPETEPVTAADPEGGGFSAYPALDANGLPGIAVRQEVPGTAVQTALLSGNAGGPISGLAIGRSGAGDGLLGFRQGEAGEYEIVGDSVSVPPAAFKLKAPKGWVKPSAAKLTWGASASAAGGVRYSVLVDGAAVRSGLRRLRYRLPPALSGNGVLHARVMATDSLGEQALSKPATVRIDGQAPTARVTVRRGRGQVTVKLADHGSGLERSAIKISFGDGTSKKGHASTTHRYAAAGRYRVTIRAADKVGNRLAQHYEVTVR